MKILIPMAGAGSRFITAKYKDSKPLIDVNGLPMIIRIIDNLPISDDYIFIIRQNIPDLLRLKNLLKSLKPHSNIIEVDKLTQGAAETCLLAKEFIDDEPLLIANCDQIQNWDTNHFIQTISETLPHIDGTIITFKSTSAANSYVLLDDNKMVIRCAEKEVISNDATTGVYYWTKGSNFVKYAQQMIYKNIRTNNEFYVCPVYNEIIQNGGKITVYPIQQHWPIGTPKDLKGYVEYVSR
jgi:dTDP-glucose pyrophosphorylase